MTDTESTPGASSLEARLRDIEDRLEIYNLLASHPPSADTGADYYTRAIFTEDGVFDRGESLDCTLGSEAIAAITLRDPSINKRFTAASPTSPGCLTSNSTAIRPTSPPTCSSSTPTPRARSASCPITASRPATASTASSPTAGN